MPWKIDPRASAATSAMAQKPSEKYSHGPSRSARRAMTGERNMAIRIDSAVPMKLATMAAPRAFTASPFRVIG